MKICSVAGAMLLLVLFVGTAHRVAAGAAGKLSASDVIAHCKKAYDALHSYRCHTDVTAHGAGGSELHATADIAFVRPGHIRASGTGMMGSGFAYVSDGKTTSQKLLGTWRPESSAEMAIAGATGIGQSAATIVPALLLHTAWGNPFGPMVTWNPRVTSDTAGGHACYKVTGSGQIKETCWIDKKTFLLDQVSTDIEMGKMSLHQLQKISAQKLNPSIPASTFTTGGR